MKPMEHCCDPQRIDDYLDERLSGEGAMDFERHLDHCDACRHELQERSAEPEVWRDAAALLGGGEDSAMLMGEQPGQRRRHALSVLDSLTPTDDPEMLGRVGDYEISGVIGVGGMGAVLKGFDKSLRRVVAIKVMAPHLADSGSARSRFQREARAAAAITHVNVIDTYGVSEANGLPYLVMPFARGPSLQKRIDESGPLSALEVVRIGRQIAAGLAAAHEQGLVHRDIKPANILLNEGIERLWITDFGVARALDDASMTQTGVIAGTPQYMSPEQARGETVDQRSDLFSLGSVLYTACTGRPPFRSEAAYGILRRITDTDPRPIREVNPEIPEWLCRIIQRLMAKHPTDRFQNANEVAELLEACLAHLQQPTQADLPPCLARSWERKAPQSPQSIPARTRSWRAKAVWVAVALAGVFGVGLAMLLLTSPVDISGHWTGEMWPSISLSKVEQADGWYSGSFTDADGHRGALRLEWSRLHRRYNGHWKAGGKLSGSVTVRQRGEELRGAISHATDSPVPEDRPRLWDFSWRRAAKAARSDDTPAAAPSGSPTAVQSPISGRLVRWGDDIRENAVLTKGALIAEIDELDQERQQRLESQMTASKQQLEAARALVVTSQKSLAAAQTIVSAFDSQLKAYRTVMGQISAGAEASVRAAENKVDAAKAELLRHQALLKQRKVDFDRQKNLFDEGVVSQEKFQEAERKFKESDAWVQKAKANVEGAENDVVVRQNEEQAKQEKAKVDVEHATAQSNKAQGDVVLAEAALAKAQLELQKSERDALELQAKLAKQERQMVIAPFDGIVRKLTQNSLLKEGDTLCLMWPVPSDSQPDVPATAPTDVGSDVPSDSVGVSLSGLSGTSVRGMAETLGAVSALGRRFRSIQSQLRKADATKAAPTVLEKLQKELAGAKLERETTVTILKGQLDAAVKLNEFQTTLRDSVKLRVANGDLEPFSLPPAEQAVLRTAAEIRQIELLIEYYSRLGSEQATPDDEQTVALAVIKVQLEAARSRLSFQTDRSKLTKRRFELGHVDVHEVLEAEQAEAAEAADVQKFEALLRYYESSLDPPTESTDQDAGR